MALANAFRKLRLANPLRMIGCNSALAPSPLAGNVSQFASWGDDYGEEEPVSPNATRLERELIEAREKYLEKDHDLDYRTAKSNLQRFGDVHGKPPPDPKMERRIAEAEKEFQELMQPELLERYLSTDNMSTPERWKLKRGELRMSFSRHESDSGSTEIQVALITSRIAQMTDHLKIHRQDKHSKKGLDGMLMQRQKLLKYMRRTDPDMYQEVLTRLGLKDRTFIRDPYESHPRSKSKRKVKK